jgi:hypothetical protein
MLRISLFGPPNRRKQPERYAQFGLKWLGILKKYFVKKSKIQMIDN